MSAAKTPRKSGTATKATKKTVRKPKAPKAPVPRGRPVKYETVEQIQERVESYWETIGPVFLEDKEGNLIRDVQGKPIKIGSVNPNILGLAEHLDITLETLNQYQKREDLSATVTRAKQKIQQWLVSRFADGDVKPAGLQFQLKNQHGWKDESTVNSNGTLTHQHGGEVKQVVEFRVVRAAPQPDEQPKDLDES